MNREKTVSELGLTDAEIAECGREAERLNAETAHDEALRADEDARDAAFERGQNERDDEPMGCYRCAGSGEGMYDGSCCSACGGSGELRSEEERIEREADRADYLYDQERDRDLERALDNDFDGRFDCADEDMPF